MQQKKSEEPRRRYFTPSSFLDLLERERQWFEMLMLAGLSPGGSPVYQVRVMLIKRTDWLRN
jgi:hypothetical protein